MFLSGDQASRERANELLRPFIKADFITENGFWGEPWEWLEKRVFDNGSSLGELCMYIGIFVISFDEKNLPNFGGEAIFCIDFYHEHQHLEETPEEGAMPFDVLSAFSSSLTFRIEHPDFDYDYFNKMYFGDYYYMRFLETGPSHFYSCKRTILDGVIEHQFPSLYKNEW